MIRDQFLLDLARELIVDNFAGGGGELTRTPALIDNAKEQA